MNHESQEHRESKLDALLSTGLLTWQASLICTLAVEARELPYETFESEALLAFGAVIAVYAGVKWRQYINLREQEKRETG